MNWFMLYIALGCCIPLLVWGLSIDTMARMKNRWIGSLCIIITGAIAGALTSGMMYYWDKAL